MKKVWIDPPGTSSSASSSASAERPISPRKRLVKPSASLQRSVRPSGVRSSRGPRATPDRSSAVEDRGGLLERRPEDHDEHHREDEDADREQHLDRRLLRPLL